MSEVFSLACIYLFFRLAPLFLVFPITPLSRIPVLVRVVITFYLSVFFAGTLSAEALGQVNGAIAVSKVLGEFFLGVLLVFGFHAAFAAVHMVGQLLDMQIGFIAGSVFDPSTAQMSSPTSQVFILSLGVFFFISDFHYTLIRGLVDFVSVLPPGEMYWLQSGWYKVIGIFFAQGIVIFSPVIIAVWLVDMTMAIISRAMPQAQVYFVALPIKVFIGLVMIGLVLKLITLPLYKLLSLSLSSWDQMLSI